VRSDQERQLTVRASVRVDAGGGKTSVSENAEFRGSLSYFGDSTISQELRGSFADNRSTMLCYAPPRAMWRASAGWDTAIRHGMGWLYARRVLVRSLDCDGERRVQGRVLRRSIPTECAHSLSIEPPPPPRRELDCAGSVANRLVPELEKAAP
jgi:hypothetical protein